jgi:hypothetical protein
MQSETLIRLIEEMIELKIRQHAAASAASTRSDPHLARIISQTHAADHRRLEQIKGEIAKVLSASEPQPSVPAVPEPPRLRMSGV